MKNPAIVGSDITFTLASPLVDHVEVEKTDAPSGISDHSCLLKLAGHLGNARAPYPHHLRKKLLRKGKIRSSQIVHPQKPFACSRLNGVQSVTSCRYAGVRKIDFLYACMSFGKDFALHQRHNN